MNYHTLFFASYELLSALIFGLFTVFIAIRLLNATFFKAETNHQMLKSNVATSLFVGTMILSTLILVQSSILPSVDTLRTMVLSNDEISADIVLTSMGYSIVFYAISLLVSSLLIFLSTNIYLVATIKIDEMAELKQNNISVALVLSLVLLGMTFFIRQPLQRFIASLVDYDQLSRIEIEANQSPSIKVPDSEEQHYIEPKVSKSPE